MPLPPRTSHDRLRLRTVAGQAFDEVIRLKQLSEERRRAKVITVVKPVDVLGDVPVVDAVGVHGHDPAAGALYGGGVVHDTAVAILSGFPGGVPDISPSLEAIDFFLSFLDSSSLPDQIETELFTLMESDILLLTAFRAFVPPFSHPFNLPFPMLRLSRVLMH